MRFSRIFSRTCAIAVLSACALLPPQHASAADEAAVVPFTERYRDVLHGGVVSAANSVITCGEAATPGAVPCDQAQRGASARGGEYDMAYIDADADANTYNSSRASLSVPPGSHVTQARLYWGANIRVGEQKPPEDNGRVLIAEPGGDYKALTADSVTGHRDTGDYESYTASADVTALVRAAGSGTYTVGQINVAMGHSPTGGWGGWALVAAYENENEPLREVVMLDGSQPVEAPGLAAATVSIDGLRADPAGEASLGVVAFGGDRGRSGDALTAGGTRLTDGANPATDVMNSTISRLGETVADRQPDYANTLGFDADVLDASPAVSRAVADGGDRLDLRFASGLDGYELGAVFLQADALAGAEAGAEADGHADGQDTNR